MGCASPLLLGPGGEGDQQILQHILDGEYAAALRSPAALQLLHSSGSCPDEGCGRSSGFEQHFRRLAAAAEHEPPTITRLLAAVAALYLFMQANLTG